MVSLALAVLFAVALCRQLPAGHLTNTDELFTAERARELRFSGPGTVWDNFQPIFRKAPLQYWLTAGALALLPGEPEAAVRLPVLLYALGTAGLVAALARSVSPAGHGRWTPPLAVAIFVLCPLTLVEGSRALLDMGLAFWTTAVLLATQRARAFPGWWLLAGTAAALGSLQKIPLPAGVLVGVIALRLVSPSGLAGLRAARAPLLAGLALAGVGTVFWPVWQAAFHGMPARGAFALDEAGNLLGRTRLGARSEWEVLDRLTLRWSWGLFALGAAFALALRRPRAGRGEGFAPVAEVAVVCLGIVLGITLGGFRSVRYVLPAVPGLCALAAVGAMALGERPGKWRVAAGALSATLLALGVPPACHKLALLPPSAPDQHPLAVALGGWRRPGEEAVLVREPDDEAKVNGVLPAEFYLFYGNLRAPVRSVTRGDWGTWEPPAGGALGVCRAEDFERVRERLPGVDVRLAKGAFVLWRGEGGKQTRVDGDLRAP